MWTDIQIDIWIALRINRMLDRSTDGKTDKHQQNERQIQTYVYCSPFISHPFLPFSFPFSSPQKDEPLRNFTQVNFISFPLPRQNTTAQKAQIAKAENVPQKEAAVKPSFHKPCKESTGIYEPTAYYYSYMSLVREGEHKLYTFCGSRSSSRVGNL